MKNHINYSYGHGTATVFLSLRTKKIFNCFISKDMDELHRLYGGKLYYTSRSGSSGAGYLQPTATDNDLIELPIYRDGISFLSEAWPDEVNGVKMMYPVEGGHEKSPIVMFYNNTIIFIDNINLMIDFIKDKNQYMLDQNLVTVWKYKYLDGELVIKTVGSGKYLEPLNGGLPYKFSEFVQLFFPEKIEMAKKESYYAAGVEVNEETQQIKLNSAGFIENKINIQLKENGDAVRFGLFGLAKEVILEEELSNRFKEGNFFEWPNGWVTTKNFGYRRYNDQVFAVYEAIPSEFGERFSVLEQKMEFEQKFSVFEWFTESVEEHISSMKDSLLVKVKNEYLNTVRWDLSQQISKTREMLDKNSETQLFIQDSLDSGNCVPGTQGFMDQFSLKEGMTCKEILEHKSFDKMLQNGRFRAVILKKFILNTED